MDYWSPVFVSLKWMYSFQFGVETYSIFEFIYFLPIKIGAYTIAELKVVLALADICFTSSLSKITIFQPSFIVFRISSL